MHYNLKLMYVVYILFSEKTGRYYVGHTKDLDRRIAEHNRIKEKFTDTGIPWKLVYTESYISKTEAYTRERYLKSRKSKDFLKQLILDSDDTTASGESLR